MTPKLIKYIEGAIRSLPMSAWKGFEGGAALLPDIEQRQDELDAAIRGAASREERRRPREQQAALLDLRDEKRAEASEVATAPCGGRPDLRRRLG